MKEQLKSLYDLHPNSTRNNLNTIWILAVFCAGAWGYLILFT